MEHLAFYHHGCQPERGASKLKNWVRRAARKAIMPMCQRLVEILSSVVERLDRDEHEIRVLRQELVELRQRHDDHATKLPAALAFGWDYVAMVRRLAALEEHVETLMTAHERAGVSAPHIDVTRREVERV